ncbi:hypothetical protein [Pantoea sp. Nvir]|uniref:hypothetical protein n=1 Tax=Pantoea sp. Nvir TaxID=2576760 RepID=UPI0030D4D212
MNVYSKRKSSAGTTRGCRQRKRKVWITLAGKQAALQIIRLAQLVKQFSASAAIVGDRGVRCTITGHNARFPALRRAIGRIITL